MDYIPLNNEEEIKLSNSILSTQLMMGVYPSEKYVNKVKKKYPKPEDFQLPCKILEQDKNLITASNNSFDKVQEINSKLDDTIMKVGNKINLIEATFNNNDSGNHKTKELDLKVGEYERETKANNEKIKELNESIPEIQRKKKENEDFLKKYEGEKKVWLDRLKEGKIRKLTEDKGFKYFYEAKIIKLLMEGILLEKVQDMVEKELYSKGDFLGWSIMNVKEMDEEKKEKDFQFNTGLLKLPSGEALIQEKEYKERMEEKENKLQEERENVTKEWKQIWRQIWIPEEKVSVDPDITTKRDFIINITMKVTFKLFQKLFYDIYKLKNIMLSNDEYIVMDKIRNYFPEKKSSSNRSQDELVLDQLMNIIESVKAEQEIIYCDLNPAKKTILEYQNSTEKDTTAIKNLNLIVEKITDIQERVNLRPAALVKSEVEEVRKLINELPYEKERKLFLDNFVNSSRYFDTFFPLINILMVISFITVCKKRDKNYEKRIEDAKNDILKLKGRNLEISGKWNLLKELKEQLGENDCNDIMERSQKIAEQEEYKAHQILEEVRKSLNKIIELKNQQQMSSFNFYKKIRKAIVRPKDLC